jgi:hypothetical protein
LHLQIEEVTIVINHKSKEGKLNFFSMTVLASAEEIDNLNIDTIERAIAYSAFLLRAAIVGVNRAY